MKIDIDELKRQIKAEVIKEIHQSKSVQSDEQMFRLNEVYTAQEAEQLWGLYDGAVRQSCIRGKMKKYIEKGLVRKSGRIWLVTAQAMREVFGEPKNE